MKEIILEAASGRSRIIVGHGLPPIDSFCEGKKPVVVTSERIYQIYQQRLSSFDCVVLPEGEVAKSVDGLTSLYHEFCKRKLERGSYIVSFGGGVISDVTGFAAATYLRGVKFGAVATTLLSQVDASIGGKNGINFEGYKNLIGTIRQAEFCLCDTSYLSTLPARELYCGFAEIIKHAAIVNAELFAYLEAQSTNALALVPECITKIVCDSIAIKADIVRRDEAEQNERRLLNFGHTFGHGIEALYHLPHGECVALGMVVAAKLSHKKGLLNAADLSRLVALIERYNLPSAYPFSLRDVMKMIELDKKRVDDGIMMILLERIGVSRIEKISLDDIKKAVDH